MSKIVYDSHHLYSDQICQKAIVPRGLGRCHPGDTASVRIEMFLYRVRMISQNFVSHTAVTLQSKWSQTMPVKCLQQHNSPTGSFIHLSALCIYSSVYYVQRSEGCRDKAVSIVKPKDIAQIIDEMPLKESWHSELYLFHSLRPIDSGVHKLNDNCHCLIANRLHCILDK